MALDRRARGSTIRSVAVSLLRPAAVLVLLTVHRSDWSPDGRQSYAIAPTCYGAGPQKCGKLNPQQCSHAPGELRDLVSIPRRSQTVPILRRRKGAGANRIRAGIRPDHKCWLGNETFARDCTLVSSATFETRRDSGSGQVRSRNYESTLEVMFFTLEDIY